MALIWASTRLLILGLSAFCAVLDEIKGSGAKQWRDGQNAHTGCLALAPNQLADEKERVCPNFSPGLCALWHPVCLLLLWWKSGGPKGNATVGANASALVFLNLAFEKKTKPHSNLMPESVWIWWGVVPTYRTCCLIGLRNAPGAESDSISSWKQTICRPMGRDFPSLLSTNGDMRCWSNNGT